jgi:3-oxoacyl-[acyl-carrier-protein] synthase-1
LELFFWQLETGNYLECGMYFLRIMPEQAVVLEQCEIISPLGNLSETVADCMDGISAIRPGPCEGVPVAFAPFKDERFRSLTIAAETLKAAIDLSEIDPSRTLFVFCCAKGDMRPLEQHYAHELGDSFIPPLPGPQADHAKKIILPEAGRTMVISSACASGTIAVEAAKDLLLSGFFTHAVVFGFDGISRFVVSGFSSLGALSKLGARPFDAARDGLTLGEGACIAVFACRNPFQGDIIIKGAGSANDANHRTGPSRTGDGLFRAARAALDDAKMESNDIGAIKCHGTATSYNDAMEAHALASLFTSGIPPCSSIKGAIGHTSGAGSLLEMLTASQFLERHALPPTAGFQSLGVDENVPISNAQQTFEKNTVLCLAAGFGGINSAIVLEEWQS